MILMIYFLKHTIILTGLKIKNRLIQQEQMIKNNLKICLTCHCSKVKEKEGKGLKNLTPNNLLIRLPILLVQIKAGNNSHKLK